jgi:hypothetical protein
MIVCSVLKISGLHEDRLIHVMKPRLWGHILDHNGLNILFAENEIRLLVHVSLIVGESEAKL